MAVLRFRMQYLIDRKDKQKFKKKIVDKIRLQISKCVHNGITILPLIYASRHRLQLDYSINVDLRASHIRERHGNDEF